MMKIYVQALGCKLNQSEAERMARDLHRAGHRVVLEPAEADICILNSCAVTHIAARKTRQAMRQMRRSNPAARLVVVGCYAELWPAELADIGEVEVLPGRAVKEDIVGALGLHRRGAPLPAGAPHRHTRAFVKVQDGCNNFCTYCVVRLARGPEQSRPLDAIINEAGELAAEGVREIVLTGVHVGAYGQDIGLDLMDLVRGILDRVDVPRLRLSSIEPWHLQERFFALWEDRRLCRHLHLPLQSGCDATLRRMRRRYTAEAYARLVETARAHIPDVAITTDVMVGFPGETDAEFQKSLRFVERMAFGRLHVFRYSPRPGTPAAGFPDQLLPDVSAARMHAMIALGEAMSRSFRERFLGREMEVLWESRHPEAGLWSGLTDNYLRVMAPSDADLHNRILPAHLERLEGDGLMGRVG